MFFLLINSFINAEDLEVNTVRDSYSSFETVQGYLKINNITLSKNLDTTNLVLLDENNLSINIAKNIFKIDSNNYYFYFDLPNLSPKQYNLGLINVFYIKEGYSKIGRFFTKLDVINQSSQILGIRPGYVLNKIIGKQEAPFTLFIKNEGIDVINLALQTEGDFFSLSSNNTILSPGASKSINVITSLYKEYKKEYNGSVNLVYGSKNYKIPFNVLRTDFVNLSTDGATENETLVKKEINYNGLSLTTLNDRILSNLTIDINVGEYYPKQQLIIKNDAGVDLHNLEYSFEGNIKEMFQIDPSSMELLAENSTDFLFFGLNENYKFVKGFYSGYLIASSLENVSFNIPIALGVSGSSVVDQTQNKVNETKENLLIVNDTQTGSEDKNSNWLVWVVISIIVLVFIFVIIHFYRKTKLEKDNFENFVDDVKSRQQ